MRTAAVDKEWEKLEKIPAWQLTKVRNEEVIDEARNKGRKIICVINGYLSSLRIRSQSRNCKNTKAELCSEVTL